MTTIPTPAPVPDPLASDFAAKCYPFTVWQAEAAVAMNAVAGEINTALNQSLLGVTSSSTTSLPITVTAKVLTVGTGLGYAEGMPLKLSNKANVANYIKGVVTAYNTITGQLNLLAKSVGGSGTFADWSVSFDVPDTSAPKIPELARTSNVMLMNSDSGSLVSATSSFTQTFDTGNFDPGWYSFYKNAGTGEITIPASDGRTNWVMYPNELRLFRWNGTTLTSEVITPFYATFTTSGNFIKAPGYSLFGGLLWGAGASGSAWRYTAPSTYYYVNSGGAGACHPFNVLASSLSNSTTVTVGAGGAAVTAPNNSSISGNDGGNSVFSSFTGYGGSAYASAGSGALSKSSGSGHKGGAPNPGFYLSNEGDTNIKTCDSYLGGGYGGYPFTNSGTIYENMASGGSSYYGAAGAPACYGNGSHYTTSGRAGNSVYGGIPGQSICYNHGSSTYFVTLKGTSIYGGAGGNASVGTGAQVGVDGGVRGGGGGAAWSTNNVSAVSGAGGRGELQIWGIV